MKPRSESVRSKLTDARRAVLELSLQPIAVLILRSQDLHAVALVELQLARCTRRRSVLPRARHRPVQREEPTLRVTTAA
jgi:hypothetical protein